MLIAAYLGRLSAGGTLSGSELLVGVEVDGKRIPVINPFPPIAATRG